MLLQSLETGMSPQRLPTRFLEGLELRPPLPRTRRRRAPCLRIEHLEDVPLGGGHADVLDQRRSPQGLEIRLKGR